LVTRTYVSVVSFVSVAAVIVALLLGTYLIFTLIAPGIYGGGARSTTVKSLIEVAVVLGVVGANFFNHQAIAPRSLRLFAGREPHVTEVHDHDHDAEGDHQH
jgi:hypothetical protein